MKTYLLTWNPKKWDWKNLAEQAERVRDGKQVKDNWNCANQHVTSGDRLFFLKQGQEPRGLMAAARATSTVEWGEHYNPKLARQGKQLPYVTFKYEQLLNPELEPLLHTSILQQKFPDGPANFAPLQSGVLIPDSITVGIENLWKQHLAGIELDPELAAFEGAERRRFTIHRQRERALREAKIAQVMQRSSGQLRCEVPRCSFSFLTVYGRIGKGYAQVHHLLPLAQVEGVKRVSLDDLIVVCANCHAMIHRGGQCRNHKTLIKRKRA